MARQDPLTNPFGAHDTVPVPGGELLLARAGPPVGAAEATVLAIHGITSSHVVFRSVARELARPMRVAVLAPDLRGRGRSAHLPGPYGIATHVADLLAVLDHAEARRVVVVGHSMGGYVAARFAAEHPERVAAVVLLDGGLPFAAPPSDLNAAIETMVGPAIRRLRMSFPSIADYVAGWREHPAFARAWNADVEAYARYDMVSDGRSARCVVQEEAVRAEARDLLLDDATVTALDRVRAPVYLLRAARGLRDDDNAAIPQALRDRFLAARPDVRFEEVDGVNHYTLVMGGGPGPIRVAAAIAAAAREALCPLPP